MGCFFSTIKKDQNSLKNQHPQLKSHAHKSNSNPEEAKCRVPPPPPDIFEEETVKEVLLETPISKPQVPILTQETKTQLPIVETRKDPIINKELVEASQEVSLISETCSFSTTTTATVSETREDEVTSKRSTREGRRNRNRTHFHATRKRSYTVEGNRIGGRERRSKSPGRLPENSPEKKVLVDSRSVNLRKFSDKVNRDLGERSGRRLRSSPVRAGAGRSQLTPPADEGDSDKERNEGVWMEESLENPRVSLECFIFL